MISSVLPPALTISDMDRSLAFYRDLLGFRVDTELPPAAERERWDRANAARKSERDTREEQRRRAGDGP